MEWQEAITIAGACLIVCTLYYLALSVIVWIIDGIESWWTVRGFRREERNVNDTFSIHRG